MAKTVIHSGICGFVTEVIARGNDGKCALDITSDCPEVQKLAEELREVEPFQEISHRGGGPLTFRMAHEICPHAACPVPVGIIKAIEVEAGLALPKDVSITGSRTED